MLVSVPPVGAATIVPYVPYVPHVPYVPYVAGGTLKDIAGTLKDVAGTSTVSNVPAVPAITNISHITDISHVSDVPDISHISHVSDIPDVPDIPVWQGGRGFLRRRVQSAIPRVSVFTDKLIDVANGSQHVLKWSLHVANLFTSLLSLKPDRALRGTAYRLDVCTAESNDDRGQPAGHDDATLHLTFMDVAARRSIAFNLCQNSPSALLEAAANFRT